MNKQLVIFPKGTLSPKDKERMSKEGYLAIEADDPARVVMPFPASSLAPDEILRCAAIGISGNSSAQYAFGKALAEMILSKEAK